MGVTSSTPVAQGNWRRTKGLDVDKNLPLYYMQITQKAPVGSVRDPTLWEFHMGGSV